MYSLFCINAIQLSQLVNKIMFLKMLINDQDKKKKEHDTLSNKINIIVKEISVYQNSIHY